MVHTFFMHVFHTVVYACKKGDPTFKRLYFFLLRERNDNFLISSLPAFLID